VIAEWMDSESQQKLAADTACSTALLNKGTIMKDTRLYALPIALGLAVLTGCDNLTERDENVTITLDTFNLSGVGPDQKIELKDRVILATVTGNPACTASQTTLNSLLAQVDNFDDIDEFLDQINLNAIRYRIATNNTQADASASMTMTDPATNQLVTVAAVDVSANALVPDFAPLPFTDGGQAVVQHYLSNRDASFLYCAQASAGAESLDMSVELQLSLTVTVDLL